MTTSRALVLLALLLTLTATAAAQPLLITASATVGARGGIASTLLPGDAHSPTLRDLISGKRIALDPGHGGSDTGARGRSAGLREKDVNLAVARMLRDTLAEAGAIVTMTRDSDRDVCAANADDFAELQARVDVGAKAKADIFVSVHCNANPSGAADGSATYFFEKTWLDRLLALNVQKAIVARGDRRDRGIREARFHVCRRSAMPAVLVELAFISNRIEEAMLADEDFQREMAAGIADGLASYFYEVRGKT